MIPDRTAFRQSSDPHVMKAVHMQALYAIAILAVACTLCIPAAAASTIPLEYYHMDRCPDCKLTGPLIADLEGAYDGALAIEWIDVETVEGWERWSSPVSRPA